MIVKDAFRSMRRDMLRCFFYWLTFLLTALLIFLFENISMSGEPDAVAMGGISLPIGVMLLVVIVCSLDIFFANSFYVKSKAKEMAVRLICGATFGQIASFLLIQTLFLLLLAVPAGILLSVALMPFVSNVISLLTSTSFVISLHSEAFFISAVIILYVIFWTILLNLSFAYKNAAGMLMNAGTLLGTNQGSVLRIGLINDKVSSIFGLILFLAPVVLFFFQPGASVFLTAMGMMGLYLFNKKGLTEWITHSMRKHVSSPLRLAADGLVRRDMLVLNQNILLYFMVASVLSSLLINHLSDPADFGLLLVSYVLMTFLQSMSLMFRFASECGVRAQHFHIFNALGYVKDRQKKIISREILTVYGMIVLSSLLYSVSLLGSFMINNHLQAGLAVMLILIQVIPFILWALIDQVYYQKSVGIS